MIAALFDCDGTLYTGRFGMGVLTYVSKHGRQMQARLMYLSLIPATFLYRLKLISGTEYDRMIMQGVASLLKGYSAAQVKATFEWLVPDFLFPTLRSETVEMIKDHQKQGHKVLLVSGAFQGALDVMVRLLGLDGGIGTGLEMNNEACTGKIASPLVKDEYKAILTREFCASHNWNINWAASYACADSISDRQMLEMVGHVVVVYPDSKLHALAQANQWQVLGTPR
jgi:HAD superfamily hydrolase (TIGR01490 family)